MYQSIDLSNHSRMDDEHHANLIVSWFIDRTPCTEVMPNFECIYSAKDYTNRGVIFIHKQVEIADEQYDCCICMESREKADVCALNCNHAFCAICIKTIMNSSHVLCCPICRGSITSIMSRSMKL